jgi:putative membrane protein
VIQYEPHPRWLRDILHLPVSYALRRAFYGTVGMGAYAVVLVLLLDAFDEVELPHGAVALSVLGGVISLALAFRLNNAYARWWEGRVHWGRLVNHSRNLAALVHAIWPADDRAGRQRVAGLIGDFAVGLSLHLRREPVLDELAVLTDDERAKAQGRTHPLSYVSQLLWSEIEARHAGGSLDTGRLLLVQPHARALLDVLGACERIRNTPIPFAVTATTRLFLLGFTLLVPLGLHQEFGWLAVPVSMSAYLGVAVMDVLAAELENPFGIDCNDLPTRAIAETIRRQVHEILEVERHGRPDVEPATAGVYTKIH